jgi:hypothetical protein
MRDIASLRAVWNLSSSLGHLPLAFRQVDVAVQSRSHPGLAQYEVDAYSSSSAPKNEVIQSHTN